MRLRSLVLPMLFVAPAGLGLAGGWAVVTVENPPQSLVAGVPYTLEYSVRQHGKDLLTGLHGSVEAVSGQRRIRSDSKGVAGSRYAATLTVPEAGDWTITVKSGFVQSQTTLLPLKAVKSGSAVAAVSDAERGKHLFAAKGCVTCHVDMKLGIPDPRTQSYKDSFVRQLLADPASVPKRHSVDVEMPRLGLSAAEITALTAYLAGPNSAGTR